MGRHAAPSDDEPDHDQAAALTVRLPAPPEGPTEQRDAGSRPLPGPRGRHSHPDDEDDSVEADVDGVDPVVVSPRAKGGGTAADLRLLHTDSAVRNRVAAAVVVPFVLYFAVLLVIGRSDAFVGWIWLPLILAGLGGGLLLDAAHAKAKKGG